MENCEFRDNDLFTTAQKAKIKKDNDGEIPDALRRKRARETRDFWKQWGVERLEAYHKHIGPTIKPKYVQKAFFIDFGDDVPFGLKGTMDRIDEDGAVVDNKTSKNRWNQKDVDYDLQGVAYSLAYRILEGKPEDRVQFDVMVKTKTQEFTKQFQQLVIGIEPHKFDFLLSELSNVYEMIRAGNIFRRAHKFNGSCSWCDYKADCWDPSTIWSRAPSEDEIKAFIADEPGNKDLLEKWIQAETAKSRLVDFRKVGAELRREIEKDPNKIQFWY